MNYAAGKKDDHHNHEIMGQKRQEKALREFKSVLKDLVFLLRRASNMQTVYMYWVNRSREQFVLETKSTELDNVMFKDRLSFDDHFLRDFKDHTEPTAVEVGKRLNPSSLKHYFNEVPVKYVTMLPFVNPLVMPTNVATNVAKMLPAASNLNIGGVVWRSKAKRS